MKKARYFGIFGLFFCVLLSTSCFSFFSNTSKKVINCSVSGLILEKTLASTARFVFHEEVKGKRKHSHCTAVAYERSGYKYKFITAAHCVAKDDQKNEKIKIFASGLIIVLKDIKTDTIKSYSATLFAVGYQNAGHDFAILEVELDRHTPLLALSKKDPVVNQCVFNAKFSYTLKERIVVGYVEKVNYDIDGSEHGINWNKITWLKTKEQGSSGGSSGSGIFNLKGEIISTRSGSNSSGMVIAIPISRFRKFEKAIEEGTYKYFKAKKTLED